MNRYDHSHGSDSSGHASPRRYRLGTRASRLALWQAQYVAQRLDACGVLVDVIAVDTLGDCDLVTPLTSFGDVAPFADEIETALLRGDIDLAVHSYKDLATHESSGTTIAALPARADVRDALVARDGQALADLPVNTVVGTCSARRTAQLLRLRGDLDIKPLRGDVPTRVRQLQAGHFDAIVLAVAGLQRLGMEDVITEYFSIDAMVPAPAQGALAVQTRSDDVALHALVAEIDNITLHRAVSLERQALAALEPLAPCVAAHAIPISNHEYKLKVRLIGACGALQIDDTFFGDLNTLTRRIEQMRAEIRQPVRQAAS